MSAYMDDRAWSDKYIPTIKSIIGPYLLEVSSFEVDAKKNADLVVMSARGLGIACRVRRPGYSEIYPYDFTFRVIRDNGTPTEFNKIINGFGDWFFYGHAESDNCLAICRWYLIDLSSLRAHLIFDRKRGNPKHKNNNDGTRFIAYDIREFPNDPRIKPILIGSSHDVAFVNHESKNHKVVYEQSTTN